MCKKASYFPVNPAAFPAYIFSRTNVGIINQIKPKFLVKKGDRFVINSNNGKCTLTFGSYFSTLISNFVVLPHFFIFAESDSMTAILHPSGNERIKPNFIDYQSDGNNK